MTDVTAMSDADLRAAYQNPAPSDVASMVTAEAQRQNVDPGLALRVAHQESGFNQAAVSPRGAVGVMQLEPGTASSLGVDPTDVGQNIRGGVGYLKQQLDAFKDPRLAAAAYNAGPGAVQKYGGVPPYPETQKYVDAVAPASAPDLSKMSDADLMAAYGQGGDPAAPAQPTTGVQNGRMVFKDTGEPIPDAQIATIKGLAAQLDPKADAGSINRPFVQRVSTDSFSPGQYYIDTSGKLTQTPPVGVSGVGKSFMTGVAQGAAPIADALMDAGPLGVLKRAADAVSLQSGNGPPTISKGVTPFATLTNQFGHTPQNVPEEYARTIGQMAPNFAAPAASIPARIANVLAPALTSETAGQIARASGSGQGAETAARMFGGMFGSGAASLRANPTAALSRPMTMDQVAAAKNAAYAKVDASGFTFPQSAVQGLADEIAGTVADKGGPSGARLYPAATAMSDRIGALAQQPDGIPLTQLDNLRSDIYGALVKPGDREAPIGVMMRQKIDALINNSDAPNIQEARDLNTRYSKMQTVTDKLDSAGLRSASTYSGGNYPNAVRQSLRPLVDPTSAQQIGNLTPAENTALRTAIMGTTGQNATRYASKFLTNKFVQVPASLMTHGIATPVMEAAGAILNKVGEGQTSAAVQRVLDIMAAGARTKALPRAAPLALTDNPYAGLALPGMAMALSASPASAQAQPRR